jgi:hypothetical protein
MGRVNIRRPFVDVDVWNTTKTTRIIAATHSSRRCQQIEPSLRVVNSWAKTTINLGVYVCARENRNGELILTETSMLSVHERASIKEKRLGEGYVLVATDSWLWIECRDRSCSDYRMHLYCLRPWTVVDCWRER